MLKQVHLRNGQEPLQIPYPRNYQGEKSAGGEDALEFHLSNQPRFLNLEEIAVAEAFIAALPYSQALISTGAVMISPGDPLLEASHETLDAIEAEHHLVSSAKAPGGGRLSIRERVYRLREQGFYANASLALTAGA